MGEKKKISRERHTDVLDHDVLDLRDLLVHLGDLVIALGVVEVVHLGLKHTLKVGVKSKGQGSLGTLSVSGEEALLDFSQKLVRSGA